jgi:aerobic carbon-monoxide dehydrogenase medium subunit
VKAPRFSYVRVTSLGEALDLLAEYGDDASVLAGGQSLMPTLNMRLSSPTVLVDINRIDDLKGITLEGGEVRIGALSRHAEVMASPIVVEHLPLIAQAYPFVAHAAVRNRGTFGGSVALADPASEMPACVLALNATLVLESKAGGRRNVAASDYFKGLYETERRDEELLIEARIPVQAAGQVAAFGELARRHGDFALAGVAMQGNVAGGVITNLRPVYFGSEDRPVLGVATAAAVEGKGATEDTFAAVNEALGNDLDPMSNFHADAATRLHLARVLTKRALISMVNGGGVV